MAAAPFNTTRRSLIAALSAAPVVIAAPAMATPSVDPGLARCIAAYKQAAAVAEQYHDEVYMPLRHKFRAEIEAVPHYTTERSYQAVTGERFWMSTDCEESCLAVELRRRRAHGFGNDDFGECCKELSAALEEREAKIGGINAKWGHLADMRKRSDELGAISSDLLGEVECYPVRTLRDLKAKIAFVSGLLGDEMSAEVLIEDLERIQA